MFELRKGFHNCWNFLAGRSNDGVVRIINRKTAQRELVKGFKGSVTDIAFAHLTPIILGAVDEIGNMFVYEILETDGGFKYPKSF